MSWVKFYSQGSFTPDLDAQEYAVRVGLYGLIPLLIPLCIGIAALTVHFTRKVYFSKRWLGSLLLVPTVGLLIWALVVSGTASPVAKVNDSINPVKVAFTILSNFALGLKKIAMVGRSYF